MFRQLLARLSPPITATDLFKRHPLDLASYMEAWWNLRPNSNAVPVGHPDHLSDEPALPAARLPLPAGESFTLPTSKRLRWPHLIYAYMVENTRVYEIIGRVLDRHRHGERVGTPLDSDSQQWLRNTEELFYRENAPFLIGTVSSHVRPDHRANRRAVYQRMFAMDLNHGTDDGKPYMYIKAEAANSSFVSTLEELLREVWVGITYINASSSANPTDDAKIAELAESLHDQLRSRRLGGNVAREEFAYVAKMSWLHMTLEFDSPIVRSLRAEAMAPADRLFKIAERVGLPAHALSKSFFDIADPLSQLLIQIEMGTYNAPAAVQALYADPTVSADLRTIITHWTAITGRDMKARKVAAA